MLLWLDRVDDNDEEIENIKLQMMVICPVIDRNIDSYFIKHKECFFDWAMMIKIRLGWLLCCVIAEIGLLRSSI